MCGMGECSVDAIVTDPPYGWSFMGKKWDYDVPGVGVWGECLRVLKPGGHMLVACGTRTQHRMAVNIEDAGFEIRDVVAWVYGSGFPKSLNIGKEVDRLQGNERVVVSEYTTHDIRNAGLMDKKGSLSVTATKGTSPYEGWGTALKPAMELWTLARKPLSEKTVAQNVLKWGTGGINVDGCRVGTSDNLNGGGYSGGTPKTMFSGLGRLQPSDYKQPAGRFPANLIHDGSDEVVGLFPQSKVPGPYIQQSKSVGIYGAEKHHDRNSTHHGDSGSASRFFYCAKSSKAERGEGNGHPTVKPVSLMRYLCRLITPPKGTVLDPFMGSGTTGIACKMEGFGFIGIELEPEYYKIAEARINSVQGAFI